tara:strand:- start:4261 stop:4629 length:369 start_codon:yes stop_codon:yes gene_type:complete
MPLADGFLRPVICLFSDKKRKIGHRNFELSGIRQLGHDVGHWEIFQNDAANAGLLESFPQAGVRAAFAFLPLSLWQNPSAARLRRDEKNGQQIIFDVERDDSNAMHLFVLVSGFLLLRRCSN